LLSEPLTRGETFRSELRGVPNVILTPHIGGSTEEAQADIGHFVATKLARYLGTGTTTGSVKLPPTALERDADGDRITLVHRNTPGVLATVAGVLAECDLNIESQLLSTRGGYGYLITDVGSSCPDAVAERLRRLPQ
jgi:D-3-phosphoglycerate dehydrogenase / 2-oxoglutarate reductase